VRPAVHNAHQQPAFADPRSHRTAGTLAHSERIARHGLCLPLYAGLSDHEIGQVVMALSEIVRTIEG